MAKIKRKYGNAFNKLRFIEKSEYFTLNLRYFLLTFLIDFGISAFSE